MKLLFSILILFFANIYCQGQSAAMTYVKICEQLWATENLNVNTYRNGDPIPQVIDSAEWSKLSIGAWCWYNNDSASYALSYGRLYNWYAVNDPRGLAPYYWHVPSVSEWDKLTACLNGLKVAGGPLKAVSSLWEPPNKGATNTTGFSGLPGGFRFPDGKFDELGKSATWWTTSQNDKGESLCRGLYYSEPISYFGKFSGNFGFSVRCVRD